MSESSVVDDWTLPHQVETIRVTYGELITLDWVLCTASGLMVGRNLDELVEDWCSFRLDVWKALDSQGLTDQPLGVLLPVTAAEAKVLLVVVPTTMTWGQSGEDYGYSLKMKLSQFLLGTYEDAVV